MSRAVSFTQLALSGCLLGIVACPSPSPSASPAPEVHGIHGLYRPVRPGGQLLYVAPEHDHNLWVVYGARHFRYFPAHLGTDGALVADVEARDETRHGGLALQIRPGAATSPLLRSLGRSI